jgi:hypothetical protein
MMRGLLLIALLAALGMPLGSARALAIEKACEAPDDVLGVLTPLPRVADVLKPGSTLNILAVGSASMFGPEAPPGSLPRPASPPTAPLITAASETAFPQQMAKELEAAVPGLTVNVVARGGRGLSAADQLQVLQDMLAHNKFELVIWQTGTVEAVRNLPPSEFAQTLEEGVGQAEQAGADVVLIDPQFSRFLQTNSNIEPYEQAFQQLGSIPGVLLFHRFDLMRSWANEGQIDLERTPKINRAHAVELLHACLGAQLSRMIIGAARS